MVLLQSNYIGPTCLCLLDPIDLYFTFLAPWEMLSSSWKSTKSKKGPSWDFRAGSEEDMATIRERRREI